MFIFALHVFSSTDDSPPPHLDDAYQILLDLTEMNLLVLKGQDASAHETAIKTKLNGKVC